MRANEILNEGINKYPKELNNFQLAAYIEDNSPGFVDTERIADEYIGYTAVLQTVPVSALRPGPDDHNIKSLRNQKKYDKMDASKMPPVVVENGEVIDGNHRYRAAKKQGVKQILAYVIQ